MQKCILHYFVAKKKKKKNTKTNSIGLFITIYIENNTCQFCCCCSLSLILTFGLLSLSLLGVFVVSDSRTLLLFLGFLFFIFFIFQLGFAVVVLGYYSGGARFPLVWYLISNSHDRNKNLFSHFLYFTLYFSNYNLLGILFSLLIN